MRNPSLLALALTLTGFVALFPPPSFAQDKKPWSGKLRDGTVITADDLKQILARHGEWIDDLRKAGLYFKPIEWPEQVRNDKRRADLSGAHLARADLSGADLGSADLSRAHMFDANLSGANLWDANLSGTYLASADLSGANLNDSNLEGVRFESIRWGDKTINVDKFITARGLDGMYLLEGEGSLVALRSAFRERQLTEQARAISVSISRGRQRAAFHRCSGIKECDPFEVLGAAAAIVLFELPVEYGARPFRALWMLAASIIAFGLLYYFLPLEFANPMETVGDFLRVNSMDVGTFGDSAIKNTGYQKSSLLEAWEWRLRDALWFSFLSATHFGTKFFSVQTLFRRLQREDYVVEATGWLRVMSGVQSILSVYLLALFAITYFQSRVF